MTQERRKELKDYFIAEFTEGFVVDWWEFAQDFLSRYPEFNPTQDSTFYCSYGESLPFINKEKFYACCITDDWMNVGPIGMYKGIFAPDCAGTSMDDIVATDEEDFDDSYESEYGNMVLRIEEIDMDRFLNALVEYYSPVDPDLNTVQYWFYKTNQFLTKDEVLSKNQYSSKKRKNGTEEKSGMVLSEDGTILISYREADGLVNNIPESVTTIGEKAFFRCDKLNGIVVPPSVTVIGNSAFYGCNSLKMVSLPSSLKEIGDNAFFECRDLKHITIPSSVSKIGAWAFADCDNLETVKIPTSIAELARGLFYSTGLKEFKIPASVTKVGGMAFGCCKDLKKMTIPVSVKEYGDWAFGTGYNIEMTVKGTSDQFYASIQDSDPKHRTFSDYFLDYDFHYTDEMSALDTADSN